jgi:hypothetical protein
MSTLQASLLFTVCRHDSKKIRSEKSVSEATFAQNDLWLCMVSEFLEVTPPSGRVSVLAYLHPFLIVVNLDVRFNQSAIN